MHIYIDVFASHNNVSDKVSLPAKKLDTDSYIHIYSQNEISTKNHQ